MDIFGYILGVALHILSKWGGWKTKGRLWMDYWHEYAGVNLKGAVCAVVCFGAWGSGMIPGILNTAASKAAALFGHAEPVHVPTGFWGALFAGFILDSIAKTLLMAIEKRAHAITGEPGDDL